jgi:hypothetical protein
LRFQSLKWLFFLIGSISFAQSHLECRVPIRTGCHLIASVKQELTNGFADSFFVIDNETGPIHLCLAAC